MQLHRFVIERELPGAGRMSPAQLHDVASKSCDVLKAMGPTIQWIESYVTDDRIYCVYLAQDADQVREHASKGGFPVNRVSEVRAVLDPTSAY